MSLPPSSSTTQAAVRNALRGFLTEEVLQRQAPVPDHEPLDNLGVDSYALMEVVLFVERRYGMVLPLEHMAKEHVRTLHTLAAWTHGWLDGSST